MPTHERPNLDEIMARLGTLEASVNEHHQEARDYWGTVDTRLDSLDTKMERMNGNVARVVAEIGPGLPEPNERGNRMTMRERMHKVEADSAAIQALGQTLGAQLETIAPSVKKLEESADRQELIAAAHERWWGRTRVIVVTVCAVVGAMSAFTGMTFAIVSHLS